MEILKMVKSWIIAVGLFIAGCVSAFFFGKRKQSESDKDKATRESNRALTDIISAQRESALDVNAMPISGPDSAAQRLRDRWQVD